MSKQTRKRRIRALLNRWETIRFANSEMDCAEDFAAMIVDLEDRLAAGVTLAPTPPDALDVERLAKAMRKVHEECRDRPYDLIDVPEDVAHEYAALAQPEEADRADG